MIPKGSRCCGFSLRALCLIIGYMHLVSSIVDMVCHMLVVAIVTNGFQCDVNNERLHAMTIPGLEPVLMILNLGTHGFYPYPRTLHNQYNIYVEQMSMVAEPKCYPGMLHVNLIDVLNMVINLIWLKIVVSYIVAVHKGNTEPMRLFFSLSIVKLIMLVMYFGYHPLFYNVYTPETIWFLKLSDIFVAVVILIIVQRYTRFLRMEKAIKQNIEKPPSYIECLINSPVRPPRYETSHEIINIEEGKKDTDNANEANDKP